MEFMTPIQQKCYEKITPMIHELFGETFVHPDKDMPLFWLTLGSAQIRIFVFPFGDDASIIQIYSTVVLKVEKTPDLMEYLLRANVDMRFGAFGIDRDGDVIFQHSIVGDTCEKAELRVSIAAVASTADLKDDEIIAKFGGQRALDMMSA